MEKVKRTWDMIPDERRKAAIDERITYFKTQRNEEIGMISAEEMLDFFLYTVGIDIYNKGIDDSRQLIMSRIEDLELDIGGLRKG